MILAVVIMATIFSTKESVGIILPMLIVGDIIAVTYYRKSVIWKYLISLIPWVLIGLIIGFFVLWKIESSQLELLIGFIIIGLIGLHIFQSRNGRKPLVYENQHINRALNVSLGILAGFTTMVGNAAGGVMAIYFLSKGLPKNEFVGTGSWFYLTVNLIKVPFNVSIGLITWETLMFNAWMIPVILLGTFAGIKALPIIPQKYFQAIILFLAAAGALKMILF